MNLDVYLTNCEPDVGGKLIKRTKHVCHVPFDMYLKRLYSCNNNENRNQRSLVRVVSQIAFDFWAIQVRNR